MQENASLQTSKMCAEPLEQQDKWCPGAKPQPREDSQGTPDRGQATDEAAERGTSRTPQGDAGRPREGHRKRRPRAQAQHSERQGPHARRSSGCAERGTANRAEQGVPTESAQAGEMAPFPRPQKPKRHNLQVLHKPKYKRQAAFLNSSTY
jgi:hypothetical protein